MIRLDKNSPKYIYKFNVAFICFLAVWFTAVVAVMVAIGCIYGEHFITYAVMIGGFALFFIGFVIFWLVDNKLHKRLIDESVAELEKEFIDMPFEEAERILKEKGIISDTGFVIKDDGIFGDAVVPFEKALLMFEIDAVARIELKIILYKEGGESPEAVYDFDRAMFNYILVKDTNLKDNGTIKLLQEDKKEFSKTFLKYSKTLQWDLSSYRYR